MMDGGRKAGKEVGLSAYLVTMRRVGVVVRCRGDVRCYCGVRSVKRCEARSCMMDEIGLMKKCDVVGWLVLLTAKTLLARRLSRVKLRA